MITKEPIPRVPTLPKIPPSEKFREFVFPTSKSSRRFRAKVSYWGLSVLTGAGSVCGLTYSFINTMSYLFNEHRPNIDQRGDIAIAVGIGLGIFSLASLEMARRQKKG